MKVRREKDPLTSLCPLEKENPLAYIDVIAFQGYMKKGSSMLIRRKRC